MKSLFRHPLFLCLLVMAPLAWSDFSPLVQGNTWVYHGRFSGFWAQALSYPINEGFEERLYLKIDKIRQTLDTTFFEVVVRDSLFDRWPFSSGSPILKDTVFNQVWVYAQSRNKDSVILRKVTGDIAPHFQPMIFRHHFEVSFLGRAKLLTSVAPRRGYALTDTLSYAHQSQNWYLDSIGLYWSYEERQNFGSCGRAAHELFLHSFNGELISLTQGPDTLLGYRKVALPKSARANCTEIRNGLEALSFLSNPLGRNLVSFNALGKVHVGGSEATARWTRPGVFLMSRRP